MIELLSLLLDYVKESRHLMLVHNRIPAEQIYELERKIKRKLSSLENDEIQQKAEAFDTLVEMLQGTETEAEYKFDEDASLRKGFTVTIPIYKWTLYSQNRNLKESLLQAAQIRRNKHE